MRAPLRALLKLCARLGHSEGDVAARVAVRFDELLESLRLIRRHRSMRMPQGPKCAPAADPTPDECKFGLGMRPKAGAARC